MIKERKVEVDLEKKLFGNNCALIKRVITFEKFVDAKLLQIVIEKRNNMVKAPLYIREENGGYYNADGYVMVDTMHLIENKRFYLIGDFPTHKVDYDEFSPKFRIMKICDNNILEILNEA